MYKLLIVFILFLTFGVHSQRSEEDDDIENDDDYWGDLNSYEDSFNKYEEIQDPYLGNYFESLAPSNTYDHAWCPQNCEEEGRIFENSNLSSFCKCERKETGLIITRYNCIKTEIYNSTIRGCYKLIGNGFATCVMKDKQCPFNETGIFIHPNNNLYKNYIICLTNTVIVAECNDTWYYNSIENKCKPIKEKNTTLLYSECSQIPKIDCKESGVAPIEDYFWKNNKSIHVPEECKNCYYFCNDKNLETYELVVKCFPELTTVTEETVSAITNAIKTSYGLNYTNHGSISNTAVTELSTNFIKNKTDKSFTISPSIENNTTRSKGEKNYTKQFTDIKLRTELHTTENTMSKETKNMNTSTTKYHQFTRIMNISDTSVTGGTFTFLTTEPARGKINTTSTSKVHEEGSSMFAKSTDSPTVIPGKDIETFTHTATSFSEYPSSLHLGETTKITDRLTSREAYQTTGPVDVDLLTNNASKLEKTTTYYTKSTTPSAESFIYNSEPPSATVSNKQVSDDKLTTSFQTENVETKNSTTSNNEKIHPSTPKQTQEDHTYLSSVQFSEYQSTKPNQSFTLLTNETSTPSLTTSNLTTKQHEKLITGTSVSSSQKELAQTNTTKVETTTKNSLDVSETEHGNSKLLTSERPKTTDRLSNTDKNHFQNDSKTETTFYPLKGQTTNLEEIVSNKSKTVPYITTEKHLTTIFNSKEIDTTDQLKNTTSELNTFIPEKEHTTKDQITPAITSNTRSEKISNMTTVPYSTDINENVTENSKHIHFTTIISNTTESTHSSKCKSKKDQICEKEGFFRLKNSCSLHYECYYSEECATIISSDIYECPNCLKFNAKLMRCDIAENVPECTYRQNKSEHVDNKICTGPGKFPVPNDNKKYYDCAVNNSECSLTVKRCANTKNFNPERGRCTSKYKPPVENRKCGKNLYVHDKFECRKFFHCQNEVPKVSLTCPKGYIFNGHYCQSQSSVVFCNWEKLKKDLYKHKSYKQY